MCFLETYNYFQFVKGKEEYSFSNGNNNANVNIADNEKQLTDEGGNGPSGIADAVPSSFICLLSYGITQDQFITLSGSTYEKVMIRQWLQIKKDRSTHQSASTCYLSD